MAWYLNKEWNDTIHSEFYAHYKKASAEEQGLALVQQAKILIESAQQHELKAAESLLLLWNSRHYKAEQEENVKALINTLSGKLHNLESAQIKPRVRHLRPE